MRITYDPDKNARNIAERGLSFDDVINLDWNTTLIVRDERRDCGQGWQNRINEVLRQWISEQAREREGR